MSSRIRAWLVWAALLVPFVRSAQAEPLPPQPGPLALDLRTAVARARERAPRAVAALARIDDARARRSGANAFAYNPELSLGGGARSGEPRTLALRAQLTQQLELGQRTARVGVADAAIERAVEANGVELRELELDVSMLFSEARFADLAIGLAQRDAALAVRAMEAAQRRRKAGQITDLDVNLATIAVGRAHAGVSAAQSQRADAIGRLAALVGAVPGDTITLVGDLRPAPLSLEAMQRVVGGRQDIRVARAEARSARADAALATASSHPDIGLWIAYERDESDTIALGGLTLTLPLWNRAQGDKAAASAREKGAKLEQGALVIAATRHLDDAFEAYTRAREAVDVFDREVAPQLADSEQLLEKSIESGQLAISDYLVARQQILDGRREQLEREWQLANAAATARFVAGVSP